MIVLNINNIYLILFEFNSKNILTKKIYSLICVFVYLPIYFRFSRKNTRKHRVYDVPKRVPLGPGRVVIQLPRLRWGHRAGVGIERRRADLQEDAKGEWFDTAYVWKGSREKHPAKIFNARTPSRWNHQRTRAANNCNATLSKARPG